MTEQENFEQYAVVELFGHQTIAGMVGEQSIGGEMFVRVDVPEVDGVPGFTKFYGGKAIYAITPCTQEAARIAAGKLQIRPISHWIIPDPTRALPEPDQDIQFDDLDLDDGPDPYDDDLDVRSDIAGRVRDWLDDFPLFIDVETTGLDDDAEICGLAVLSLDGDVLLDALIKPTHSIPPGLPHGLTDDDVIGAPTFAEIWPTLRELLIDEPIVVYNARFAQRVLERSAAARGIPFDLGDDVAWRCAMEMYAAFYGDWDNGCEYFRLQSLSEAARQCSIPVPTDIHRIHRARTDAELTRLLMHYIAAGSE